MTNGEKIKEIFPNLETIPNPYSPSVDIGIGSIMIMRVDPNWWDAEYKEPTTENDLEVDAVSRQAAIDAIRRIHPIDTDYDCTLYDKVDVMYVLNDLPSVTPQPRKGHWIGHRKHCENLGVIPSGLGAYEWCSNYNCGIDIRELA